jgi:hypothetical protein
MSATPDRTQVREVLRTLATKTQSKIPALNGRVEKACKLVLGGDVELHSDGTALVNSLTHPTVAYMVAPGLCQCKDFDCAPEHLCCHRLAVGFSKKLVELVPQTPEPAAEMVPEARSCVNFRAMINNFEVQITLRDASEEALLGRLQTLLTRPDIKPVPKPAPRSGNWKGRQYQDR